MISKWRNLTAQAGEIAGLFFMLAATHLLCLPLPPLKADPPNYAQWEMTFQEEFDGPSLNWEVWESEHGPRGADKLEGRWPENNLVKDGILYQITKRENPPRGGKDWSTAHIWTRTFQQQYGYFEARIKYGRYLNNAFWVVRPQGRFPDPPHFEIDINEGHTPREVAMTLHVFVRLEGESQEDRFAAHKAWNAPLNLDQDFHIYGADWTEKDITFYFDGAPIWRVENTICHAPADVRLSTVIMPHHLQRDGVNIETMDGVRMAVDWVRVYRKKRDLFSPNLPDMEKIVIPKIVQRPPQVAQEGTRTVVLKENFEQGPAGGLPPGWEVGDGSPAVVPDRPVAAKKPLGPDNHVLQLKPQDYAFRLWDVALEHRFEVVLDFLAPRTDSLLFVTLGEFDKTDPQRRKTSYYTGDIGPYIHWMRNYVHFYTEREKWVPFARWKKGEWERVRIVLDARKGVFDYYGGEALSTFLGSGLFRGRPKAARGIGLRHRGTSGIVYLDNVIVNALQD